MVLIIRTDKAEAEIGLYVMNSELEHFSWHASRELSTTLHRQIEDLLARHKKDWHDIKGIVIFKGPGSFTGLRIGFTVANTLASELNVPIVSELGEDWAHNGLKRLTSGENEIVALPEYGAEANITKPRK